MPVKIHCSVSLVFSSGKRRQHAHIHTKTGKLQHVRLGVRQLQGHLRSPTNPTDAVAVVCSSGRAVLRLVARAVSSTGTGLCERAKICAWLGCMFGKKMFCTSIDQSLYDLTAQKPALFSCAANFVSACSRNVCGCTRVRCCGALL